MGKNTNGSDWVGKCRWDIGGKNRHRKSVQITREDFASVKKANGVAFISGRSKQGIQTPFSISKRWVVSIEFHLSPQDSQAISWGFRNLQDTQNHNSTANLQLHCVHKTLENVTNGRP